MRTLSTIASALLALMFSANAVAGDFIETPSAIIPLAAGWFEQRGSVPFFATGSNGEVLLVSIFVRRSKEKATDPTSSIDEAEAAAVRSISSNIADMTDVSALKTFVLSNGTKVHERIRQTIDKQTIFLGLVLRHDNAVILITIEGPSCSGGSIADARLSTLSLLWK